MWCSSSWERGKEWVFLHCSTSGTHLLQTPRQKEAKTTLLELRQKRNPADNETFHTMFDLQQIAS